MIYVVQNTDDSELANVIIGDPGYMQIIENSQETSTANGENKEHLFEKVSAEPSSRRNRHLIRGPLSQSTSRDTHRKRPDGRFHQKQLLNYE